MAYDLEIATPPAGTEERSAGVSRTGTFAALGTGLLLVVLVWSRLLGRDVSLLPLQDAADQTYVWWCFASDQIGSGHSPLWDPYLSGGRSKIGEGGEGFLNPLFWGMQLATTGRMAPPEAIELWALLHGLIGFLGAWVLAKSLRLSCWPATMAGLVFTLGAFFSHRAWTQLCIFNATAWVPLALAGPFLVQRTGKARWGLLSGVALAMSILSGHLQPVFYAVLIISFSYLFMLLPISEERITFRLALTSGLIAAGTMAAVALPQLLVTFEYLTNAYRWVGETEPLLATQRVPYWIIARNPNLQWDELRTLFFNEGARVRDGGLFVGAVATALAAAGLTSSRRWKYLFAALFVVGILVALGNLTPFARVFYALIPASDKIREPVRALTFTHVALAALAALGLESLLAPRERSGRAWKVALLVATLIAAAAAATMQGTPEATRVIVAALGALLVLLAAFALARMRRGVLVAAVLLCLGATGDLGYWWWQGLPRVGPGGQRDAPEQFHNDTTRWLSAFFQAHPGTYRIELLDSDLPRNVGDTLRIPTLSGYGATLTVGFFRFRNETGWLPPSPGFDLLGARYLVAPRSPGGELPVAGEQGRLKIYENRTAYPLAWIVDEARTADDETALRGIREGTIDPHRTAFVSPLSAKRAPAPSTQPAAGSASIRRYDPSRVEILTTSSREALLVTSEPSYPGWTARIDGRRAPLLRVNYAFRGLTIPAGRHRVTFTYGPWYLWAAIAVACASLAAALLTLWRTAREPVSGSLPSSS